MTDEPPPPRTGLGRGKGGKKRKTNVGKKSSDVAAQDTPEKEARVSISRLSKEKLDSLGVQAPEAPAKKKVAPKASKDKPQQTSDVVEKAAKEGKEKKEKKDKETSKENKKKDDVSHGKQKATAEEVRIKKYKEMQKKNAAKTREFSKEVAELLESAPLPSRHIDNEIDLVDLTYERPFETVHVDKVTEGIWADLKLPKDYQYSYIYGSMRGVKSQGDIGIQKHSGATSDKDWKNYLKYFQGCTNWLAMKTLVENVIPAFDNIPDQLCDFHLATDTEDLIASHCMAVQDVPYDDPFAVRTLPDGDCLFHALSRLIYGNQHRHIELRVRMLYEAVKNEDWYLSHDYLTAGLENWQPRLKDETDQASQIIRATGLYPHNDKYHYISPQERKVWYHKEIFGHRFPGEHCGLFILHVMSNVLRRPIVSLLPETAKSEFRDVHRTIQPFYVGDRGRDPAVIMWTFGTYRFSSVNHFVPIVPRKPAYTMHQIDYEPENSLEDVQYAHEMRMKLIEKNLKKQKERRKNVRDTDDTDTPAEESEAATTQDTEEEEEEGNDFEDTEDDDSQLKEDIDSIIERTSPVEEPQKSPSSPVHTSDTSFLVGDAKSSIKDDAALHKETQDKEPKKSEETGKKDEEKEDEGEKTEAKSTTDSDKEDKGDTRNQEEEEGIQNEQEDKENKKAKETEDNEEEKEENEEEEKIEEAERESLKGDCVTEPDLGDEELLKAVQAAEEVQEKVQEENVPVDNDGKPDDVGESAGDGEQ